MHNWWSRGTIGSSFIKAVLRFAPHSVIVVDLNENGLTELVRDVRNTEGLYVHEEFRCYTLNLADPIFECIFREEKGFDITVNPVFIETSILSRFQKQFYYNRLRRFFGLNS